MDTSLRPDPLPPAALSALISGLGLVGDTDSREPVTGITLDSRAVQPGWLYVAVPGSRAHGAQFAASAIDSGAVAVLTDDAGMELIGPSLVPVVAAADVRTAMATVAEGVHRAIRREKPGRGAVAV